MDFVSHGFVLVQVQVTGSEVARAETQN
jgi:hypothetical protein